MTWGDFLKRHMERCTGGGGISALNCAGISEAGWNKFTQRTFCTSDPVINETQICIKFSPDHFAGMCHFLRPHHCRLISQRRHRSEGEITCF